MTDRLDEIRSRAEAATPGPWGVFAKRGGDVCEVLDAHHDQVCRMYAYDEDTLADATFIAHAREDIPYLLAEVEQLPRRLAATDEECDRLMDLYLAQRREHNKAVAEVERLRAALTDVSFRCERCELDFAADGIDARNRCHQCHNDVHFGQPTVQWNPILGDIGNTTITKGGES